VKKECGATARSPPDFNLFGYQLIQLAFLLQSSGKQVTHPIGVFMRATL